MSPEARARLLALMERFSSCRHKSKTKVPGGWECDDCHAEIRKVR